MWLIFFHFHRNCWYSDTKASVWLWFVSSGVHQSAHLPLIAAISMSLQGTWLYACCVIYQPLFSSSAFWTAACWWPLPWSAEGFCVAGSCSNKHAQLLYVSWMLFLCNDQDNQALMVYLWCCYELCPYDECTRVIRHWGLEWLVCVSRRVEDKGRLIQE